MVNWQITATTIYCDAVYDEVTFMVYGNGTIKCTGYTKYSNPSQEVENLLRKRSKELNKKLECQGLECPRVTQYRDKLFAEDTNRGTGESN